MKPRAFLLLVLPAVTMLLLGQGCGRPADAPAMEAASPEASLDHDVQHHEASYVCPMHPQVVRGEPGRCPICGMDLVRKVPEASPGTAIRDGAALVQVSPAVVNQLGVRAAPVRRGTLVRTVKGFGVFLRTSVQGYRPVYHGAAPSVNDADTSTSAMLVQAQVFERDAPLIKVGQSARVRFPGLGDKEWTGTVIGLEAQVNQVTHTQVFHVSVDPEAASVPAGMSASLAVEVDPVADVLLVPRDAVIATGQGARVVIDRGAGSFESRVVQVEDLGEDEIVIRSGLQEGERVVVSAQFLLDSEANVQAGLQRLSNEHVVQTAPEGAGR